MKPVTLANCRQTTPKKRSSKRKRNTKRKEEKEKEKSRRETSKWYARGEIGG
jgi:hypothetical protein